MAKIPEWKKAIQSSLKENISKIGSSATYASLATVRENNTPAVRTIVIRGFAGEHHKEQVGWQSNILLIMTKNSSAKVKELTKNPKTEINWYMDGTKEQFRIGGTIDIIEKNFDQSKLNHLSASVTKTNQGAENDKKSLGLQSFLKRQGDKDKFDWEAERLRQFIQCSSSLRADMIRGDTKELEIKSIDLKTGWFQNDDIQDLLEQSFEKFTLLAVTVQSVGYYSAETVTTAIFSPSDDESNYRSSLLLRNEQNDMHLLNIPSNLPKNKLSLNTVRSTELLSASRPKLHTKHSSDTYRLPTLERLENAAGLSRNAKITVEPVSFAENSASNMTKGTGSQSDVKSVRSFNGSINNSKKKHIKHKKKSHHSTPTEVFAKNLSEAVLDVDDSCDGYVYHTPYKLYPPLSPPISPFDLTANSNRLSTSCNDDSGSYFSDCHRQKPRRPGLRSAVSELPAGGTIKPYYFDLLAIKLEKHGLHRGFRYRCSSSEDEDNDEESTPLLYYSGKKDVHRNTRSLLWKKESRSRRSKLKSRTCFWWLTTVSLSCFVLCFIMILLASPLHSVEIFSVGNVLGTQKQLMIDLYVRARNSNSWNIQVSHAAISLFAASHYVPTIAQGTGNTTAHEKTNNKQEYLGTLNKLDDPLIFEASPLFYFNSKLSTPASHIQIKNPGEAKDDVSGNERWSLLIRYPYELTLRGVLRYQLFPFFHTKTYSARVCKVVHVNPATGAVGEAPLPEQSICDED